MKISSIEIENICSLKGHHKIDFENLHDISKILAITGKTGSGKSSILSSICLALYGQNIKKTIAGPDLVTLGTLGANVTLNFSVNNNDYRAIWSCKVAKKNGEPLKKVLPKRQLFKIDGDKVDILDEQASHIIGLSFDQFTKTVILNQGKFSDFLLSNYTDRKKILETLYKSFDLSNLSQKNNQQILTLKNQVKNLEAKLEGINLGHNKDIESLEKEIKEKTKILNTEEKLIQELEANQKTLHELIKGHNLLNTNKEKISLTAKELSHFEKENAQNSINLKKTKNALKASSKEVEIQIPKLIEKKQVLEQIITSKRNILAYQNRNEETKAYIKNTQNEIAKHTKNIESLSSKTNEINFDFSIDQDTLNKSIQLLNKNADTLKSLIEKNNIHKNLLEEKKASLSNEVNIDLLNKTIKDEKDTSQKLSDLLLSLKHIEQIKEQIVTNKASLKEVEKTKVKYLQKTQSLNKKLNDLREKSCGYEEELILNKDAIAGIILNNIKRQSLDAGKCQVCDSTDLSNIKLDKVSLDKEKKYQANIDNISAELEKTKVQIDQESRQLIELQSNIELKDQELKKLKISLEDSNSQVAQYDKLKEQSETLAKKASHLQASIIKIKSNLDIQKQISADIEKYSELVTKEEKQINLINEKIKEQIGQFNKSFKSNIVKLSELRAWENQYKQALNLNTQINASKDAIRNLEITLKRSLKSIEDNLELIQKEQDQLDKFNKLIDKNDTAQILDKAIKTINDNNKKCKLEYDKYTDTSKKLHIEISSLKSKKTMLTEQVNDLISKNTIEISKLLKIEMDTYKNAIYALKDINYPNDFDIELTSSLKEDYTAKLESHKTTLKEVKKQITQNQTIVEQYNKAKSSTEVILKEKQKLDTRISTLEDLHKIIGKDEFRNYVLSIIESNLLIQTNTELKKLCDDRYKIAQIVNTNKSTDFYIEDRDMFYKKRKISTLSGGETFMISLAMAIALCEMTRGDIQIESFFIDEGFGTLDEDSIEEVLDMLESIKDKGKMITLISHIKNLTDRFPVNIHIDKKRSGSQIQVVNH
ncbi:MAG: SMC family ATPase [Bacteriovoracaceae bacterium]|jgi:exonuclease SbcC|nr:SMC family ATPase [Bacteriovoracaceae bacterium]